MNPYWTLDGRKALVTGATKGIGKAIAEELMQFGAEVCIVSRNQAELDIALAEWKSNEKSKHWKAFALKCDVSEKKDRENLVELLSKEWNMLDILINNVGTNRRKKMIEYDSSDYDFLIQTNLTSMFELSRLLYPMLKKSNRASVVNISSVAGLLHLRTGAIYAMTKAAINQLTKNLAVEWAPDHIRVNAVAPWYIRTPLAESVLKNEDYLNEVLARTPMKRIGEPHEVAGLVTFLCTESAGFITGQVIAIDGGFSINGF
jgi:Tropinone reductase 1